MQVTLVAHYGEKGPALAALVLELQGRLQNLLGDAFRPYELNQVHSTIIGLEGCRLGHHVKNENSGLPMDLGGLVAFLQSPRLPSIQIQVGGYRANHQYPFRSRDAHPYVRSFSVQGDSAVAIGWPVENGGFPDSLDRLRRRLQEFGVRHKWHRTEVEIDNDCFLVLGKLDRRSTDAAALGYATGIVRAGLASLAGTLFEINRHTLRFVGYSEPQLQPRTSCWYRLDEPDLVAKLEALYSRC